MKNFLWLLMFIFLLGIYIDIGWKKYSGKPQSFCNGAWYQRIITVQTIIPFLPDRRTFFIGVGPRRFEWEWRQEIVYEKNVDGERLEKIVIYGSGCTAEFYRGELHWRNSEWVGERTDKRYDYGLFEKLGEFTYFINLNFNSVSFESVKN